MANMKTCKRCELSLPLAEFYPGRATCKECKKADSTAYYYSNLDKAKSSRRSYYSKNKDAFISRAKAWKESNLEAARASGRTSQKRRVASGMAAAACAKRRTKMRGRELTQSEKASIRFMYAAAKELTKLLGVKHEVDHIMPIAHGGIHEPSNLQVVPAEYNRKKSSKILNG